MVERFTIWCLVLTIVLLTPEVQIEDMPGVFNLGVYLPSHMKCSKMLIAASGANEDGLGGGTFENPLNSPMY